MRRARTLIVPSDHSFVLVKPLWPLMMVKKRGRIHGHTLEYLFIQLDSLTEEAIAVVIIDDCMVNRSRSYGNIAITQAQPEYI